MSVFARLQLLVIFMVNSYAQFATIYVDSTGNDNNNCGSQLNPCGTIGFASALSMYHNKYINVDIISLFVSGQNEQDINEWNLDTKSSLNISFLNILKSRGYYFRYYTPCSIYINFNKSVDITFNSNTIKTMSDWYPDICQQLLSYNTYLFTINKNYDPESSTTTLRFNNLIVDNFTLPSSGYRALISAVYGIYVVLNNCFFNNINKNSFNNDAEYWHYMITASQLTINNSVFTNIQLSGTAEYETAFIRLKTASPLAAYDLTLFMNNCTVRNYNNVIGTFVYINAGNFYSNVRDIDIINCVFDNIITSYSLIKSFSNFGGWKVSLNMKSVQFLNINLGSILVTQNGHYIIMEYISITTI
eukprot:56096_1